MTLTIGRVGLAAAKGGDGYTLDDPHTVDRQGKTVAVQGIHTATTQADLMWRAQQILGLVRGDDERVVPVAYTSEASLNGFYRVLDAAVLHDRGTVRAAGYLEWAVQLEELTTWRLPRVEYPTDYGLRVNSHSITAFDMTVAVPGAMKMYSPPFTTDANTSRPVSDGSSVVIIQDIGATTTGTSGIGKLVIPADDYYHGGCRVEFNTEGAIWRTAVGRISFPATGSLRISNGLVRATIVYGTAASSDLDIEWWDGTQWDTATDFYLEGVGTHGELVYYSAEILRNTPERVVVRFTTEMSSISDGVATVDFSLRRGLRWLHCLCESAVAPATGWRAGFGTSTPSTSITGGVRRTSDNAGGNREILTGPSATTVDTANGRVTTGSTTQALLGIGCEVGGSTAIGASTAANQIEEFYGFVAERGVVVAS